MAKRPSLVGIGRQALAAATGEKPAGDEPARRPPAAEAAPAPRPARRPKGAAARERPAPAPAEKPRAVEREPVDRAQAAPRVTPPRDATTLYRELLAFGTEQLRQAVEAATALSRCRSPAEVIATQAQYARITAAQYGTAALKLMGLMGSTRKPQ